MSTRGCIVRLEKEVCKVAYLHYGADFVSHYIYEEGVGEEFWDKIFEAAKEWDELEGLENNYYREITNPESIERLYRYDDSVLNDVDAEVFIYVEHLPRTEHCIELYDVTIKRNLSVENDEDWKECWEEEENENDWIRRFVGVKSARM